MHSITRLFISILGAVLVLSSCASNSAKVDPSIASRLDEIYAVVLENPSSDDLFKEFCTADFSKIYFESDSIAAENGEVVLGYNLWINAQDWDTPSVSVASAEILSDNNAEAILNIKNMGYEDPVKFILSKEDNEWKVADFQYNYDDKWVSTLSIMETYIKDNK